jgi:hypothetical protein
LTECGSEAIAECGNEKRRQARGQRERSQPSAKREETPPKRESQQRRQASAPTNVNSRGDHGPHTPDGTETRSHPLPNQCEMGERSTRSL